MNTKNYMIKIFTVLDFQLHNFNEILETLIVRTLLLLPIQQNLVRFAYRFSLSKTKSVGFQTQHF